MDPNKLARNLISLVEIVSRLRGPGGCPWDAEQTDSTIKIYLLEEAYEVLDAVEKGSPEEVCAELGDLLFQILFLARLADERGEFDLVDVIEGITEKMIRRHPHVFGDAEVENSDQVAMNWAKIKKGEKADAGDESSGLKDIPAQLPALLRGHRLGERAARAGLDLVEDDVLWDRIKDKVKSMEDRLSHDDSEDFERHFGDLMLFFVDLARRRGQNSENLVREANQRFIRRFERVESILRARGTNMEEATRKQKRQAWEKAGSKGEEHT